MSEIIMFSLMQLSRSYQKNICHSILSTSKKMLTERFEKELLSANSSNAAFPKCATFLYKKIILKRFILYMN